MQYFFLVFLASILIISGCQKKPEESQAGAPVIEARSSEKSSAQEELDRRNADRDLKAEDLKMKRLIVAGNIIPPKPVLSFDGDFDFQYEFLFHKPRLTHCFYNALVDDQTLKGSIEIHFYVDPTGKLEKTELSTDINHDGLKKCYQDIFSNWKFSASSNNQPKVYKGKLSLMTVEAPSSESLLAPENPQLQGASLQEIQEKLKQENPEIAK